MTPAIEVRDVRKSYGDTTVLAGVDLAVEPGEVYGLLGPNGAGKTTLVRILSTLLPLDGGRATIHGLDVVRDARRVRALIGLTGQYASVDELLTGHENLVMIGRLLGLGHRGARRRADELLERFDLVDAGVRRSDTYSGGMRRRLDLAASLVAGPAVVFLDEPTTGLDPTSRRTLWAVIRELAADGTTILLTTQYLEEADQLADRIAVLDNGTIVTEGTGTELKRQVGQERLTLRFASRPLLTRAHELVGGTAASDDDGSLTLTLPLNGAEHLRDVLNGLAGAAVAVADVALHSPTLDDVFFAVTGADNTQELVS